MEDGKIRFTFMTFVFSVTLGLVISTLETPLVSRTHALLKLRYVFPALLLTVDMWVRYNEFHSGGERSYSNWFLFLDTLLLTMMYASLASLKATPSSPDAHLSWQYPPEAFWWWLLPYSILKVVRGWRMVEGTGQCSWYSVLHVLLLVLIMGGWAWQRRQEMLGIPFAYSGLVFVFVTLVYLGVVYRAKWNPLKPVLKPAGQSGTQG